MLLLNRFLRVWLPAIDLVMVAGWFAWMVAPPNLIPPAPFWVEVYLPALVLGMLFLGTTAGLIVGKGRESLGWIALGVLAPALLLECWFAWIFLTFPADF